MRIFDQSRPDLNGAKILVTGGTGSFGKAFIRRVLSDFAPKRVVIFSRDELKQYEMERQIPTAVRDKVRFFIGDVRDVDRLELAMRDIDIVIHAAALKHVPAAEYNPFECVKTNIHGAENVVMAALRSRVQRVIALSTDKAASPINLYGASKLASDKIFVAANNLAGGQDTRFAVVRYGNVLGSRGSVVPFFRELIASGAKSLPITHPEMTRFWITLDQGVQFVLSSLAMMSGGEVFVPKIPSMRVVDVALALEPDLPHEIVGIRPGEKLHETMITADDSRMTLELSDRFIIQPSFTFWSAHHLVKNGAVNVPSGFEYISDTNSEWLDKDSFHELLSGLENA
ncbi:UDP-N-acetylglucosamine 4,6-dehydratase (inverting) [Roseobacter sp. HKCCD7870]|uniref:UDP-N-acetylglucosamine 4,6-dehydratase (inverting) n=1 Tax=Roseobacter sp. HKCCD7870 TaxID=3120343 RepID=UPI0030ECCF6D